MDVLRSELHILCILGTQLILCKLQVGDAGPILDMMAVVLENIPTSAVLARSTIYAVYRTAQVICSIPNISYHKKVGTVYIE